METYDLGSKSIDFDALEGQRCWIGVDMSATTDLSAVVAAFHDGDGGFIVVPHFFCPASNLRARSDRDRVPYVQWAEDGFITATPGDVIDYRSVEQCIRELAERYQVCEIGFDRAYGGPVMSPLIDDGFPCVILQQGWVTQSPALNELERAIVSRKFQHGGHPVLRWCFDNVAIHTDTSGNRVMHKGKSTDRIDGAAATWMAVSRAAAGDDGSSIYDDINARPDGLLMLNF